MPISKKLSIILAAVLIFLLGIGIGFWWGKSYSTFSSLSFEGRNETAPAESAERGFYYQPVTPNNPLISLTIVE